MESILLFGAYSAVDMLGKMLTTCSCFQGCTRTTYGMWDKRGEVEMDNMSIAPVCDNSSQSSDLSLVQQKANLAQTSTINVSHKSACPSSVVTTSTRSTFSIKDNEVSSDHYLKMSTSIPIKIKAFHLTAGEEFIEVRLRTSSNSGKPSMRQAPELQQRRRRSRQQYNLTGRDAQRHQFIGHTKRNQKVRQLLADEIATRRRRSEGNHDQESLDYAE